MKKYDKPILIVCDVEDSSVILVTSPTYNEFGTDQPQLGKERYDLFGGEKDGTLSW